MAGNLIGLDEAAKMLGVTTDELNNMCSNNEIFPVRGSKSVQFKMEEIERVADERGIELGKPAADMSATTDMDDELALEPMADEDTGDDFDSVLVSEESLGHSGESTSSTIIGKGRSASSSAEDSDLTLGSADAPPAGSDIDLIPEATGTDLNLIAGDSDNLAGASDVVGGEKVTSEPSTGKLLAEAGDDDLEIAGDSGLGLDDEVDLGGEEDDDLVLGGSGASDLTLGAGDSGINLSPTDSGLSLEEEPIDLGGSSADSLVLPEDEDVIALEEEPTDPDAATQLKADDEFLLTPVEEAEDESSGSQVIALEDSDVYADQDAQTMLGAAVAEEAPQPALVAEDVDMMGGGVVAAQPGMAAQPIAMPAGAAPTYELPERPYSVWNVLFLLLVFMFLLISGIFMTDLLRSLWSYQEPMTISTTIMDSVVEMVGGLKP